MNTNNVSHWNKHYQSSPQEVMPCSVLKDFGYLLPSQGVALDLACGLAGNAFYMAEKGLHVHAVDISQVAIDHVNQKSEQTGLSVKGIVRDVETDGLADGQYDVIVVSHFLNRALMADIINHLNPAGLLFYQTWTKEKKEGIGPQNENFLLNKGELLDFCKDMEVLHYQEEGLIGDTTKGFRNQARIIAVR